MTTLHVFVVLLAVWRLARLITTDTIGEPLRAFIARRFGETSSAAYLFTCPWCISVWLGAVVVVPNVVWPDNRAVFAATLILAASAIAGLLATIEGLIDSVGDAANRYRGG